ncbi:MAG: hypothetical protein PPP58_07680 [Natronomonas sp.]
MEVLVGLVGFTLGLVAFVFPRAIAEAIGTTAGKPSTEVWTQLVRGIGAAIAIGSFVLLV